MSMNSLCKLVRPQLGNVHLQLRHATKKAGGSTRNGRDSPGQRLGVKKFGNESVIPGNIILRQRGRKWHNGEGTKMGRDHTIYAIQEGWVQFDYNKILKRRSVSVTLENPHPHQKQQVDAA